MYRNFFGYVVIDKSIIQDRYKDYWATKGGLPLETTEGYVVFLDKNEAKDFATEVKKHNKATVEIRKVYLEIGDAI